MFYKLLIVFKYKGKGGVYDCGYCYVCFVLEGWVYVFWFLRLFWYIREIMLFLGFGLVGGIWMGFFECLLSCLSVCFGESIF